MSTTTMIDALADGDYKRAYFRVSAQLEDARRVHGAAMGRVMQRTIGLETQLQQSRAETALVRAELCTLAALVCKQPDETVRCRMAVVMKQLQRQSALVHIGEQDEQEERDAGPPDAANAAVETQLAEAKREIQRVQDVLDEYTASSAAVEEELEQELVQSEKCNAQLRKKVQSLQSETETLREKLTASRVELSKCAMERDTLRAQEARLVATTRRLEQDQDDLETHVRVLEATEEDLRHELDCEREDKVFLASDHEELERDFVELKEHHRIEMEELKSELYATQQKLLLLMAPKTPLENPCGDDAIEADWIVLKESIDVVEEEKDGEESIAEEAVVEEPEPEAESSVGHEVATTQAADGVRSKIVVPAITINQLHESQIELRLANPLSPLEADFGYSADRPALAVVTGVAPTPSKLDVKVKVQPLESTEKDKKKAKSKPTQKKQAPTRWRI